MVNGVKADPKPVFTSALDDTRESPIEKISTAAQIEDNGIDQIRTRANLMGHDTAV
jgi:hypothetical protein